MSASTDEGFQIQSNHTNSNFDYYSSPGYNQFGSNSSSASEVNKESRMGLNNLRKEPSQSRTSVWVRFDLEALQLENQENPMKKRDTTWKWQTSFWGIKALMGLEFTDKVK